MKRPARPAKPRAPVKAPKSTRLEISIHAPRNPVSLEGLRRTAKQQLLDAHPEIKKMTVDWDTLKVQFDCSRYGSPRTRLNISVTAPPEWIATRQAEYINKLLAYEAAMRQWDKDMEVHNTAMREYERYKTQQELERLRAKMDELTP